MSAPSRTQLDQTGERIRAGTATAADWHVLTEYRLSVRDAIAPLLSRVRDVAASHNLPFTARLKTDYSIEQKLQRMKIRLRQIDDIMGCRIIVPDRVAQDACSTALVDLAQVKVRDRREQPSHGYRAVHIILGSSNFIEVQIRTELQDAWSELSERLADRHGIDVKYGKGPHDVARSLMALSTLIDEMERDHNIKSDEATVKADLVDDLFETIRTRI